MALLCRARERAVPIVVGLGDRGAVAGQPLHHCEMALLCCDVQRGLPEAVRERRRRPEPVENNYHLEQRAANQSAERPPT